MATSYDLNIIRGSDFSVRLNVKDSNGGAYNLSGYSVSGVAKYRYSSSNPLIDLSPVIVSGVNGASYVNGMIDVNVFGTATTGVPIVQGVYDIEIYKGSYHEKVIHGKLNVLPEVTSPLTSGSNYNASGSYY